MPKKKAREDKSRSAAEGSGGTPFNAAFAGLAALRSAPSSAPAETEEAPVRRSAPVSSELFVPGRKVVVRKEKKGRGGKTVTRVQGLGGDAAAIEELARALARELGCGAQREAQDILLQGHQTARAVAALTRRGAPRVIDGDAPSR